MVYPGAQEIDMNSIPLSEQKKIMKILDQRGENRDISEVGFHDEQDSYYFSMIVGEGEAPVYHCINKRDCH